MSNLLVTPELVAAAAADLAGIGSAIGAANAAAGAPTMALLAAGADEVSAAVAAVFSSYAQQYQALSAAAAAFHDQFVRALAAGAGAYAGAEAANVEQQLLNAINAPTLAGALIAPSSCCSTLAASALAYAPAVLVRVCTICW